MKFRQLRLAGFKSFVDPVGLSIENGLTGVVGPNGCGKSNLLEAIRWVMGESSPKSMRGGGMEDVIFAGTDRRPGRDVAEVKLSLDNTDRKAPAQFNESDDIEVTRHIERGIGSAYRINGRDVRQRDVQLLFADAATGAHSPALVSQGRIGAIINAKPQDRRQLLEEAAGIAGLHVRRKDAEQRLKAAEVNLARLSDVLAGMESQAASLRRQARAAARYKDLSEKIALSEGMLLYAKWRDARAEAEAARAEADLLKAELDEAAREAARINALQEQAKTGLPALRRAEAEAAAALQALRHKGETLDAALSDIERRARELSATAETAEADAVREADFAEDAATAIVRLDEECDALVHELEKARAALPAAEAMVETMEGDCERAETAHSKALGLHADARAQRRAAEASFAAAEESLRRAETATDEADRMLAAAASPAELERSAEEAAARLQAAEERLAEAAQVVEAAEMEHLAGEEARGRAQSAHADAASVLAALRAEERALTRQQAAQNAEADAPLIDAVRVKQGYEEAFATAFGETATADIADASAPRHWRERSHRDIAALPEGCTPLEPHVEGPASIALRLAHVGIVETPPAPAMVAALHPGQLLVSREGALWRWDGYEAAPGAGGAAAETLRMRNRLAALSDELKEASRAEAEAEAALADARDAAAEISGRTARARNARAEAEEARAAAANDLASLAGELERARAQREAAETRRVRATEDKEAAKSALEAAADELAALPSLDALGIDAEQKRRSGEALRAKLAEARAEHVTLLRGLSGNEARLAAIARERADWDRRAGGSHAQREALLVRAASARREAAELSQRPAEIEAQRAALAGERGQAERERQRAADELAEAESAAAVHDAEARAAAERLADLKERRGRLDAQLEGHELRRVEMGRIASERFQTAAHALPEKLGFEESDADNLAALGAALERLQAERERMGPVNLRAATELEEIRAELDASNAESEDLHAAIARLRGSIGALNREGRARLLTAFEEVDKHFRHLFIGLFGGGEARLELVESDDPLLAGLEVMAQPPGKKLQSMSLLSGGEQALSAVALIFAIFLTNPAPICVLDEVDAPLDDANIERFCDLLDRMTALTDTRFLIVTHNAVTMSRMHRLYGVTMAEQGVSQLVSVDLGGAETLLAAE